MTETDHHIGQSYYGFRISELLGICYRGRIYRAQCDADGGPRTLVLVEGDNPFGDPTAAFNAYATASTEEPGLLTALGLHGSDTSPLRALEFDPVEGQRLQDRLAHLTDLRELFEGMLDGVGRGLAAAHDRGLAFPVIHPRDVVLSDGEMGLPFFACFDFFLQGQFPEPLRQALLHADDNFSYLAPEHLGVGNSIIGRASDIYSFGLVLAALGDRKPLPMGTNVATAAEARARGPEISRLPDFVGREVLSMTEPDSKKRASALDKLKQRPRPAAQSVADSGCETQPAAPYAGYDGSVEVLSAPMPQEKKTLLPSIRTLAVGGGIAVTVAALVLAVLFLPNNLFSPIPLLPNGKIDIKRILAEQETQERFQIAETLLGADEIDGMERKDRNLAAFKILRVNEQQDHAFSAFMLAGFYDPTNWEKGVNPMAEGALKRCRPLKAIRYYKKADELGHEQAASFGDMLVNYVENPPAMEKLACYRK